MVNQYEDYVSNLINSVTQNLSIAEGGAMLIKHYNTLNLKQETIEKCFHDKKGIKYVYHEFDGSVMADAYEPFLSSIKKMYYDEYNMPIEDFLDECGVYELHKSILKTYFEKGICRRADEVLISEIQFEGHKMEESIGNMLQYVSLRETLLFIFNKINNASESTLRILLSMMGNEKYSNISLVAAYNEVNKVPDYTADLWKKYMDYLVRNDCIIEWNFNEGQIEADFKNNFIFSLESMPDYLVKLSNMYQLLAIRQAEYYLSIIYKKLEVEQLYIPEKYTFLFMELYANIALMLDNNSDAMIYAEAMRNANSGGDMEKEFRYKYLIAKICMFTGQNEEAKNVSMECYDIAKEQGNEFNMFRAKLSWFMAEYSGWKDIMFLDKNADVEPLLLENAKKYGYFNQLAHIYVFAFDNEREKLKEVDGLEERLRYFYKGIKLAKKMGNDQLLIEGYRKNVMIASTNGFFDVCNYYYTLWTEVASVQNNDFEKANIYNGLGYNNCAGEKYAKANDYYNKALIIFDRLNEPEYVGETLYNMAINAMLASEYQIASEYLEMCLVIVRALKIDSLRICNVSKLFGLLALCYYRMGITYSCKIAVQSSMQYLDHLFTFDTEAPRQGDYYLWDDDLFLCHYINALIFMDDEKYEQALDEFNNAQKYMETSPGFLFFSVTQFCVDKALLYKHMGKHKEAENIIVKCREFCEERGYIYKVNMLTTFLDKKEGMPMRWNMTLKGITLSQIEDNVNALAVQYSYTRQKHHMEFLSIWQKNVDNYEDTPKKLIESSINTFKNYFNMDYVLFIRFENGVPKVKYDDSTTKLDKQKINYLVNFFAENRTEVVTSRTEINYFEYRNLIDNVLCNKRINSAIFAPIFTNEKQDSIFITYSVLKDSWNSLNNKVSYGKDELPMFMFVFRELLAAIERLEDKKEIESINKELKKVNDRLSQLAITDMLTGLLNRQGLSEKTEQLYGLDARVKRKNELTIMYADLDNFKYYNDTFGHDVGDIILCGFANIIKKICDENNGFAVRYGGDEFMLIINSVDREEIDRLAKLIYSTIKERDSFVPEVCEALGEEIVIPQERKLSTSIGIFFVPEVDKNEPKKSVYSAISRADEVLYHIKKTTKHRHVFYDDVKDLL